MAAELPATSLVLALWCASAKLPQSLVERVIAERAELRKLGQRVGDTTLLSPEQWQEIAVVAERCLSPRDRKRRVKNTTN